MNTTDTKHPAEVLADRIEQTCPISRNVYPLADGLTMLRRIPALEAERGVLLSAVEEWRKLADWQSARLAKMEADQARQETLIGELGKSLSMWIDIHENPAGFVGKYGKALDAAIAAQQARIDAAAEAGRAALKFATEARDA